jgi:hypothetical protein
VSDVERAHRPHLDKSTTVDIFTAVDVRREKMPKLFRKSKKLVEFCDRCARVCDAGCRAAAIRNRAVTQALRSGARI